ncbi:CDP-diacylglycerol-inositol 3-phosphatidyltransferase [Puccinia graminis f. sp. tritici]|uniref:CDP-diacylglycerol-inositol 3-phosphatidyltransferase n=1 Tax=Puccinia graminis f. sp. tritici TaxID=56615 RepID=A0A5B0RBH0_PUCGR|nr:CDP-diacylglycerol-inositol 3-phosphatidyltransferase [Puccinia graminis f. sp. tritici]KAA1123171.1 CDP-diacylglycerol-inositol 3-phosphatidyltransferase [Puccinia graminis f. sp. tritici]
MTTTTNQPTSSSSSSSSQTRTSTQPLHHQSNIPSTSDENVFLFLPNLIGYTRIILAAVSLHFMSYHPIYCTIAYIISQLLDAVDGQVARMLGQTSKFGAVLDMVTDRCTTSCLLCFLSSVYPQWAIMFQSLIALDFASHYIHMYSSMVAGSKSHKTVSKKQSRILHSYYTNSGNRGRQDALRSRWLPPKDHPTTCRSRNGDHSGFRKKHPTHSFLVDIGAPEAYEGNAGQAWSTASRPHWYTSILPIAQDSAAIDTCLKSLPSGSA